MRSSDTRRALLVLGCVLLLAPALAGCGRGQRASAKAEARAESTVVLGPSDVAVGAVQDLQDGVAVSGTLAPAVDVRITSPMAEVLEAVLVKEGQAVRRGQTLGRFRSGSLGPVAASARARERIARSDYDRMKNLAAAGAVSQREVENAEAALRAAEAAAADAEKRLREALVRSPITGVVAERHVQGGDRVGEGDPLFRVVDVTELEFEASVTAEHAGRLRVGSPVSLTVPGHPAGSAAGRIARINATADPATRQVRLYVVVPNRDHRLVGDLFASGRVVLREAPQAVAIPVSAVRREGRAAPHVWVVAGRRLEKRDVTLGIQDDVRGLVQVTAGIRPGETVIVSRLEGLAPGQPVQLAGRAG